MKTAFKAKIIVETDHFNEYWDKDRPVNMREIIEWLNRDKNIQIEAIGDPLTNDLEPVIIFKFL